MKDRDVCTSLLDVLKLFRRKIWSRLSINNDIQSWRTDLTIKTIRSIPHSRAILVSKIVVFIFIRGIYNLNYIIIDSHRNNHNWPINVKRVHSIFMHHTQNRKTKMKLNRNWKEDAMQIKQWSINKSVTWCTRWCGVAWRGR